MWGTVYRPLAGFIFDTLEKIGKQLEKIGKQLEKIGKQLEKMGIYFGKVKHNLNKPGVAPVSNPYLD